MDKCSCYHEIYNRTECWGTKEREVCSCSGDKTKCNFYQYVREAAQARKVNGNHKTKYTYEETREQFLLALNSNAYINMCTCDDMINAINALEKQIPVEHHHTKVFEVNDKIRISVCPSCLWMNYTHKDEFPEFCNKCGQKIDWSENVKNEQIY